MLVATCTCGKHIKCIQISSNSWPRLHTLIAILYRPLTSCIIYFYRFKVFHSIFYYCVFSLTFAPRRESYRFLFLYTFIKIIIATNQDGAKEVRKECSEFRSQVQFTARKKKPNLHYELSKFVTCIIERINILSCHVSDLEWSVTNVSFYKLQWQRLEKYLKLFFQALYKGDSIYSRNSKSCT